MSIKINSDKVAIRYYILINIILASVFFAFLFSAYKVTNLNLSIQNEAFQSRFSSRLFFKSLSNLKEAKNYLIKYKLSKEIQDLEASEDSVLTAHSDYKILLSELGQLHSNYYDSLSPRFDSLKNEYQILFQNPKKQDVSKILETEELMIKDLYEQESIIWQKEASRFSELSELKNSNFSNFNISVIFFIILEIGLIFFTYLRHKLIKKIEDQNEQLIIQARMSTLGVMSAELAHEINTPLMVIDGRLKQVQVELKKSDLDQERIVKNIDTIIRNSNKIQSIVKNFKMLSKDGKLDNFEKVHLKEIFFELNEMVSKRIEIFNISVHYILPETSIEILVRRIQILQVFINLLNNAIDAIKNNSERWIKIEAIAKDGEVYIYVTDSGNGIPSQLADKLFTPFFTTKQSHEGTGLGLSLSKKIMLEHSGNLFFDKTNSNTCFVLKLPIV